MTSEREMESDSLSLRRKLLASEPLWGAVAALLAALVGGLISFWAVSVTLSEQAEQSRESAFLEERMDAYSALLRESQAFQLAAFRYNQSARSGSENAQDSEAMLASTLAIYDKAVAAAWQVDLVATAPVREKKEIIARELDNIEEQLREVDEEAVLYFAALDATITRHATDFADEAVREIQAERE